MRHFQLGDGFDIASMRQEVKDMMDVLLGRVDPPINVGILTLMEVAEAFHARAREMEMSIHEAEIDGYVLKNTKQYYFRVRTLRSFIELCDRAIDLGSRRMTAAAYESGG